MKPFSLVCMLFFFHPSRAQDTLETKETWSLSGYVKDLQWVRFDKNFKQANPTNLLHNRLNLHWDPTEQISGRIEIRNRFYWGDDVKMIPGFKEQLRNQNEAVDLSATWFSERSMILHSNVERLWFEYNKTKWNLRAGRQRINWGINNTWNPNDIFNTYNFLDFDYEERPGSDAVKGQYIINDLSHVELAFAATQDHPIVATKYFTNYKKYDLQWNVGSYQNIFTAGFGWAGSIADIGFKGEAQYFADKSDSLSQWNLAMEADYMFNNGWYLSSGILYNDAGLHKPLDIFTRINFNTSPQNLMPARWNLLLNSTKEFTPLFNGSMNVIYSPGVNMLILFPSFRYNVTDNLDVDLVWQSFFAELDRFQAISHTGFLRLKYSF